MNTLRILAVFFFVSTQASDKNPGMSFLAMKVSPHVLATMRQSDQALTVVQQTAKTHRSRQNNVAPSMINSQQKIAARL